MIEDVIFNQRASNGVSTFLPVGEVTTTGVELIWEQRQFMNTRLDIRHASLIPTLRSLIMSLIPVT